MKGEWCEGGVGGGVWGTQLYDVCPKSCIRNVSVHIKLNKNMISETSYSL